MLVEKTVFRATMSDARLFRNLIGAISSLIEEADFNATPEVPFSARVKLAAASLRDIIDDAQAISDNVRLEVSPDKFLIKASGEMSSVAIEMDKGSDAILEIDLRPETDPKTAQPAATTTPARATYNLNYLGEIIRAGSGASEVTSLEFSTNIPIKVEFEMPQQGRLLYYLAPRIEAEQ